MRFKTYVSRQSHEDFATCLGWLSTEEVVSAGDDHQLIFWNVLTHEQTKSVPLPADLYPTDLHCLTSRGGGKQTATADLLVIGATDGRYHLVSRAGKVDKTVDAHTGAVLSVRWSPDGSALATAGEDGHVKIWSKTGMLRSTLTVLPSPVYSGVSWAPNSNQVIYGSGGGRLEIKSLSPNSKPTQWKAHDGVILKVTWNQNNNTILSGGEDCRYKLWDSLGRSLFASTRQDFPITSLSWSPDGSLFAVGSFNALKLCDEAGWSCSLDKPTVHSLFSICWSSDSSQVAGACGSGALLFAYVIEKKIEWKSFEVSASGRKVITLKNVASNAQEELDFRENVIKFSMEFGHLLALTSSQCHIYRTTNWNTPHTFELKDQNVSLLMQCDRYFLLVDATNVNLYSYEARFLLSVKWLGMRLDALNRSSMSLSADTIAVRDANDAKLIHFIDVATGKAVGGAGQQPYKHKLDVTTVSLSFRGLPAERKCAFIDKNADLYIALARPSPLVVLQTVKLSAMVRCLRWSEDADVLAAFQENSKLIVWTYPHVAFVDRELLPVSTLDKDSSEFGNSKNLQLIGFQDNGISVRRSDGSLVSTSINPLATLLHTYASQAQWQEALSLCRYAKDSSPDAACLWAMLAGMTLSARQLDISELAYAAINRVDKVLYMQRIQGLTSKEARNAEIALVCGNIREAESICLGAGFVLRAILINVEVHKWNRAAELAIKHDKSQKYLQVVLGHRQRFLDRFNRSENNAQLQALLNEVEALLEWSAIEEIIEDPYERIAVQPAAKGPIKR